MNILLRNIVTFLTFFMFISTSVLFSQSYNIQQTEDQSIFVNGNSILVLPDTAIFVQQDTVFTIPPGVQYKIESLPDSITDAFYDSLRVKANKSIISKAIYDALIIIPSKSDTSKGEFEKGEENFLPFEGKTIATVRLKKVRILAETVHDTLQKNESRFSRLLNGLHFPTRVDVILNNLLFQEGDILDPFLLADNERILRALPYIEDAKIYVSSRENNNDVVDIVVVTQDVFSIGGSPTISDIENYRLDIFEKNFLGYGTELRYGFRYNGNENIPTGHDIKYIMTNIAGTFIGGMVNYGEIFGAKTIRALFSKEFIIPQTKWGGALDIGKICEFKKEERQDSLIKTPYKLNYQDFWLGHSFLLGERYSRINLIFSGRIRNDNFQSRPVVSADSNIFFHNRVLLLGEISFRQIKYVKSSLIISFGVTEDVPIGQLFQITAGMQKEEFVQKPYFGVDFGLASIWQSLGYLGFRIQCGSFIHQNQFREGTLRVRFSYFYHLLKLKRYRFRQLGSFVYTHGINRLSGENVNLNEEIRGISGTGLAGTSKLAISEDSILFTPWNIYGFRFALFGFCDFGFLGSTGKLLRRNNFYGTLGIGCRIRNESLVFKTVQLRFGYFVRSPVGMNRWQVDVSTRDPSVIRSIDVTRPDVIGFY